MPRFMTDHLRDPASATRPGKSPTPGGNIIRQGKVEEGEARGEGWAVLRAFSILLIGMAWLAYFLS